MRKIIILLVVISGLLNGQNLLQINSVNAHPGDTNVCVTVNLVNQNPVGGIQFTLHFDQNILDFANAEIGNNLSSGFSMNFNQMGDSIINLIVSFQGDSISPGNWPIANFYFDVSPNAAVGDSAYLCITNPVLSSPQGTQLPISLSNGFLRILPSPPRIFLHAGSDTVNPGREAEVVVFMENPDDPVGGFQFTVNYPGEKIDVDTILTLLPGGFTLNYNTFTDSVKIVGISLVGDSISPGSTQIGILRFSIQPDVNPDDSIGITLSGVIISSPQAQALPSGTIDGYIGVSANPTSIIFPENGQILNSNDVTVIFHSVLGASKYQLIYGIVGTHWDSVLTIDTSCVIHVPSDTTYLLRIRTVTARGYMSVWSDTIAFTVDATVPQIPHPISPIEGDWLRDSLVEFNWNRVSKSNKGLWLSPITLKNKEKSTPVRYVLKIDNSIADSAISDTSYTFIVNEGIHTWQVKAYDLAGNNSQWSSVEYFGVDFTAPEIDSVTDIRNTVRSVGPWNIEATVMDTLSGIDSVELYYEMDNTGWTRVSMADSGNGLWIGEIPGINDTLAHSIRYYVKAIDSVGNWGVSDTFNFIAIDVEEGEPISEFRVLSINSMMLRQRGARVELEVPSMGVVRFNIYDVSGREVWFREYMLNKGYHILTLSPRLKGGVYFLRINYENKVLMRRFIVISGK